jgi:hypothetical protein
MREGHPDVCAVCGFRFGDFAAASAIETLRSVTEAFRRMIVPAAASESLRMRLGGGSWSALEHASHVRTVLAATAACLGRLAAGESRVYAPMVPDARWTGANRGDPSIVLQVMEEKADVVGRCVAAMPHDAWNRVARSGGVSMSAWQVVVFASHEGAHHARLADEVLRRCSAASRG